MAAPPPRDDEAWAWADVSLLDVAVRDVLIAWLCSGRRSTSRCSPRRCAGWRSRSSRRAVRAGRGRPGTPGTQGRPGRRGAARTRSAPRTADGSRTRSRTWSRRRGGSRRPAGQVRRRGTCRAPPGPLHGDRPRRLGQGDGAVARAALDRALALAPGLPAGGAARAAGRCHGPAEGHGMTSTASRPSRGTGPVRGGERPVPWMQVMSPSAKPRFAGRQPSSRWGAPGDDPAPPRSGKREFEEQAG